MEGNLKLLVGLGNPGARYEKTRHNAGFWFLDEVAARYRVNFRGESRFQGLTAGMEWKGGVVHLLKPLTFMNRSGGSVAAVARYFKIEPAEILVAHDDLDLPTGAVRLKRGGGHGGHNGLRDLFSSLGSADFYRLRFGIGHPGDRSAVMSYVLDSPSGSEAEQFREAVVQAVASLPDLLDGRFENAMNYLHAVSSSHVKNKD